MGFTIETSIPFITVFLQGILSFFSPCVLPLVPLYIGYLSGGAKTVDANGEVQYRKRTVMLNTLFFVIGISFAFFLLGLGFTAAGRFFNSHRLLFARIGGILIILFGLYQLGIFGSSRLLSRERRLPLRLDRFAMNPLLALVFGFTFSFAWTPCVGPALASVLLMATSANSSAAGFALIGVYTLGFVIPFLAVGLFAGTLLTFLKNHQRIVRYTVKAGGVLMILMGIMMLTGWMNGITSYLSDFGAADSSLEADESSTAPESDSTSSASAPDFTLTDQYGNTHTLSDYKGKVVFLNFWMTWCDPCKEEMPDIQKLYEAYGKNEGDVIILGVANPKTDAYPHNQDTSEDSVKSFLSGGGYSYPVVMDRTGETYAAYGISAYPTTFMIDAQGNVFGYGVGMLTYDIMEDIIRQTQEGKRS
ncbi:cytochrome c biogenesis protein/redoxin [Bianquea renquensis]|jgi:hypothetical protein ELI_4332|uniref:Redoxin domain-containing protein n=1 Tax=Bianquea renquensis TaxID=2763661 RepID=A0A926DRE9_9FIRM|nr:cytochrome c biogenesis protein/redoxin [Bianquea renquensis]MBC8541935.1 redoxin domain-containing protein [Bianquea renquensis]